MFSWCNWKKAVNASVEFAHHTSKERKQWTHSETDRADKAETAPSPNRDEREVERSEFEADFVKGWADWLGAAAMTAVASVATMIGTRTVSLT
jgi:hypothetical protein